MKWLRLPALLKGLPSTAPYPIRLTAALDLLGGGVGSPRPNAFRQPSAANAEFLTAADSSYPAAGTIIAVINPTAIGSTRGGILDLLHSSGTRIWMGILPSTPDYLQAVINPGSATIITEPYTSDAALYDGTPKVAWVTWTGSSATVGWGKPSAGMTTTAATSTVTAKPSGVTASVGNVAGADSSIGGDYEVAAFARVLSDAEIDAAVDAGTLVGLAPGDAYLYPRPAEGTGDGDSLTAPSTQIVDETAHTWTISTVDGTSPVQLVVL